MPRRILRMWWAVLVGSVVALSGCTRINSYLGAEGKYLLKGYDVVSLPGQRVELRARLESGTIQRDLPGRTIQFLKEGRPFNKATTDEEGFAVIDFRPSRRGDYVFRVEANQDELKHKAPEAVELLVTCRAVSEPMVIVDVDKTLAMTKSWRFFRKDPAAMADSVGVMERLAKDYTIVYLTHRPQQYAHKTKTWLRKRGYPQGPLLMPEVVDFARGSGRYKTNRLGQLKGMFKNIQLGIGDKISDAVAYHQNGMKAFLIVDVEKSDDPQYYLRLAEELEELPEQVQVVRNWGQISAAIYQRKTFPSSAMQKWLREQVAPATPVQNSAGTSK